MSERSPEELEQLLARARRFANDDPDPTTRAELAELIARADLPELAERFSGRLTFGTAGLRGLLGAGESRMNRRVVAEVTAGLCAYLEQSVVNAKARGICVGRDARRYSRELADEVVAICTGQGFVVHVFEDLAATPLLAFSVCERKAAAGIMITASHNPPAYNGYKVYWDDGAQLLSPHDEGVAAAAARIDSVTSLPRCTLAEARARGLYRDMRGMEERYFAGVDTLAERRDPSTANLRIAYTALHGVGERFARTALERAGFHDVHSVVQQAEPDGAFPTVAFPNPEEPGAMDLALALADEVRADLVIANDPDADRLALGARDERGQMRMLSGNDTGVLLADYLLSRARPASHDLVLSSIVSTPLLARIAAAHGVHWEATLTGFKWIMQRAKQLQAERGLRFVFGFEEALGFSAGSLVHDKDGISAAVLAACMAHQHALAGKTLVRALHDLYRRHGLFASRQVSLVMPGLAGMTRMREAMRALRATAPTNIAGYEIVGILDLKHGTHVRGALTQPSTLPASDVLIYDLAGDAGEHRIAIRPSGTEPKLKIYIDVCTRVDDDEPIHAASERADALLEVLAQGARAVIDATRAPSSAAAP